MPISEEHPAVEAMAWEIDPGAFHVSEAELGLRPKGMDPKTFVERRRSQKAPRRADATKKARAALNAALPHLKPEDVPGVLPETPSEEAVEAAAALIDDIAAMPGTTRVTARAALRAAYAAERGVTSRSSGNREGGA